jgi:hypothetical protein
MNFLDSAVSGPCDGRVTLGSLEVDPLGDLRDVTVGEGTVWVEIVAALQARWRR